MQTHMPPPPLPIRHIAHPSDFSPASAVAFAHALKLALMARAGLRLLHVTPQAAPEHWSEFPGVRATLARWGLLPPDSPRRAVPRLGIEVEKIQMVGTHPVAEMESYLSRHPPDLVVLATHQYQGLARWVHPAVAAPLARHLQTRTLFIPQGGAGFVSLATGAVTLRRIVIPVALHPPPRAAIASAVQLAQLLGCPRVAGTLVYVGEAQDMPAVQEPQPAGWTWEWVVRRGPVVEQVLAVGAAAAADLLVVTTEGHHGILDALRGSTAERLLRGASCAVLTVPAM